MNFRQLKINLSADSAVILITECTGQYLHAFTKTIVVHHQPRLCQQVQCQIVAASVFNQL